MDHLFRYFRVFFILFSLFCWSACTNPALPGTGEWIFEIKYMPKDGVSSLEHYTLRFDKNGIVYRGNLEYGKYSNRSQKRLKFFSQDRKLVFYGEYEGRDRLYGETKHIPNDTIIATWTATKKK